MLMKQLKRFFLEEDGAELIEWAVRILIALGLIAIAWTLYDSLGDKLNGAKDAIDNMGNVSGGSGGTGTPITPPII